MKSLRLCIGSGIWLAGALCAANPTATLFALLSQSTTLTGAEAQALIDQALATGRTSVTLPAATINLTQSLVIPRGTRNFTLEGQAGTRIVRASSGDFALLSVGWLGTGAIENSGFALARRVPIRASLEGATTLTRADTSAVPAGWYAIIGTHPTHDIVRTAAGLTYWFRRELIYVNGLSGNTINLREPLGRAFANGELRELEPATAQPGNRQVVSNLTIRNIVFQGRSTVDNSLASRVIDSGLVHNLLIDNVNISGFRISGIKVHLARGATIQNSHFSDGNTSSLGYGVEFGASRFVTVRSSTFNIARWGVVFTSGNMDGLVEDCAHVGQTGGFDVGHGTGDIRLTYRRCVAPIFSIGNPSFLRPVENILLENCTATRTIDIYGSRNVTIRGRHPDHTFTTPTIQLFTEQQGGQAVPTESFPHSVTLENGLSLSTVAIMPHVQQVSIARVPHNLGSFTARNWTFRTLVEGSSTPINLYGTRQPSTVTFDQVRIENNNVWNAGLYLGPTTGAGRWDLIMRNSEVESGGNTAVILDSNAPATIEIRSSVLNGGMILPENVRAGAFAQLR